MKARLKTLTFLLISFLLIGCGTNSFRSIVFTNLTPAEIRINDSVYILTTEVLSSTVIDKQIGRINKINAIVSYMEKNNPYKSPGKVFKIKDMEIEEAVAVQVNNIIYKAKIIARS